MVRIHPLLFACMLVAGARTSWSDDVTELPKKLQSGVPIYDLAASAGHGQVYRIEVPTSAKSLVIQTANGAGDCDLYLQKGAHPTTEKFISTSRNYGTRERITVDYPGAGTWYVLVAAESVYDGVRLTANVSVGPGSAMVPRLNPAPGAYPDPVKVFLQSRHSNATIRYTTDGSEPTVDSPVFKKGLRIESTRTLKAAAFLPKGVKSPTTTGEYIIESAPEPATLTSGVPTGHRGGSAASETLFKITVPEGQSALRVFTGGGDGDSELFVRYGSAPTKKLFQQKDNGPRNSAMITIANPAVGDWYILLRGRSRFSGAILTASVQTNSPDLTVWPDRLKPYVSDDEVFAETDCEVVEGMIQAGTRRLLRFSTESRNLGGADVVLGKPEDSPELFEFQECHGHYHFRGFAGYRLLRPNGDIVTTGSKVSFCLEDVMPWDLWSPRWSKYDCENQGIQTGWADVYDSGLPGQWIDITNVPPGDYILEVTINPDRILPESDYTNNSALVPVTIPGEQVP